MIFQGIAQPIRYSDPEFSRFQSRIYWHYITERFAVYTDSMKQMVKAFNTFGQSMQKAAESMQRLLPLFEKFNA